MDGTRKQTEGMRKVVRSFAGSRRETRLMMAAYEWVIPWRRFGDGTGRAAPAQGAVGAGGETGVARPRQAMGA